MRNAIPGSQSFKNTIVDEYISNKVHLHIIIKAFRIHYKTLEIIFTLYAEKETGIMQNGKCFVFSFLFHIIFALFHFYLHIETQKAKQYWVDICIGYILVKAGNICMKYCLNI